MWNVPCKFQLVVGDEGFGTFRRWSFFAGNESLRTDLESLSPIPLLPCPQLSESRCHVTSQPPVLAIMPSLSVAFPAMRGCIHQEVQVNIHPFFLKLLFNWSILSQQLKLTYHNGNSEWQQHAKWLFASTFFSLQRCEPPNQGCSFRSPGIPAESILTAFSLT